MTNKEKVRKAHPDAFAYLNALESNDSKKFICSAGKPTFDTLGQGKNFIEAWGAAAKNIGEKK